MGKFQILFLFSLLVSVSNAQTYTFPDETEPHEVLGWHGHINMNMEMPSEMKTMPLG